MNKHYIKAVIIVIMALGIAGVWKLAGHILDMRILAYRKRPFIQNRRKFMTPEELKKHIGERVSVEDILGFFDVPIILDATTVDYSERFKTGVLLWVGDDYVDNIDTYDIVVIYNDRYWLECDDRSWYEDATY